ncbi:MAG TPA: hypothetical protein VMF06_08000 [Candidatus Limnocylindria bacterium]|jgi:hypothetical protein|nr:hypothetical protein [Candidatus Limnocylindria bacterium]
MKPSLLRRFIKWLVGLIAFLLVCVLVILLAKDFLARKVFVSMIEQKTGFPATVDKVEIGILTPTLKIRGLKISYPGNHGGGLLMDSPEIFVEYDREAAQRNEVHLKQLKWDIREIGLQDQDGKGAAGVLADSQQIFTGTNQISLPDGTGKGFNFTGIDTLNFSLGKARIINVKNPGNSQDMNFDVHNRIMTNITSAVDLAPLAIELLLKGAFGGAAVTPGQLGLPGIPAGK